MVFMADVFVPCDICGGRRFKPEVLEVTVRGKNVFEVLNLTIDEAIRFFPREEKLGQALWHLQQVGLGYLRLGQPATTLSGGEAQRLKIARELATAGRKGGRKLYVMDEPTTGLHLEDIHWAVAADGVAGRERLRVRAQLLAWETSPGKGFVTRRKSVDPEELAS
jgi:excinuclease ABC subunit A